MSLEVLAIRPGLDIPDFDLIGYYGADCGTMKPYLRVGNLLFLSGHVARIGTQITHKGRLGADLSTDQGYSAARQNGAERAGWHQAGGGIAGPRQIHHPDLEFCRLHPGV